MIDTMTAIMAPFQLFFLFNKGLFQYHPQYYRFLFWHFLSFSSELSIFSIIVWQISWPYLYNCTPIMYSDNIFFVGQNILLLNIMVSIYSYRNLGFSICIDMCICASKVVSGNMTSTRIACGLVYIACLFLLENVQNVLISISFLGNNQTTTITETNP